MQRADCAPHAAASAAASPQQLHLYSNLNPQNIHQSLLHSPLPPRRLGPDRKPPCAPCDDAKDSLTPPNASVLRPRRNFPLRDRFTATTSLPLHASVPSNPPVPAASELARVSHSARGIATPSSPNTLPRYPRGRDRFFRSRSSTTRSPTSPATPTAQVRIPSTATALETETPRTTGRAPLQRRPPAFLSSHGIETTYGPPPAIITRGLATSDIVRRIQQQYRAAQKHQAPGYFGFEETQEGQVKGHTVTTFSSTQNRRPHNLVPRRTISARAKYWPAMSREESIQGDGARNDISATGSALSGSPVKRGITPEENTITTESDLFLNIAESPKVQDSTTERADRRRNRIARAIKRQSLPENAIPGADQITSPQRTPTTNHLTDVPQTDPHHLRSKRISAPVTKASISRQDSAIQDSSPFNLSQAPSARPTQLPRRQSHSSQAYSPSLRSPDLSTYGRRRPSLGSGLLEPTKTYKPSRLNYASSRDTDSVAQQEANNETMRTQKQEPKQDGTTESVGSSHAPSTVWDELDELKSRIRKLELTGHMPATSGQAIQSVSMSNGPVSSSSNERPRTASTLPTTISLSPKARRKNSDAHPETSSVGGTAAANLHPNLHSALAKCKVLLSPTVYRALETTANDALVLAAMAGNQNPSGSSASNASSVTVIDRNIRRKADSMCRSLTDLCIALCDTKNESSNTVSALNSPATLTALRRGSRDESAILSSLAPAMRDLRGASLEPELLSRNSPSRALTRVEQRRTSLMGQSLHIQSSPIGGSNSRQPQEPRSPTSPTATFSNLKRSSSTRTSADAARLSERLADRTGTNTSFLRVRPRKATMEQDNSADEHEENERTLRAPSRAFTDLNQRRASTQHSSIPGPQSSLPQRSNTHRLSRDYSVPLSTSRHVESRLERSKERLPESRLGLRDRNAREYSPASDQTRQLLRNLRNISGYQGSPLDRNALPRTVRSDKDRTGRYLDGETTSTLDRRALGGGDRAVRGTSYE